MHGANPFQQAVVAGRLGGDALRDLRNLLAPPRPGELFSPDAAADPDHARHMQGLMRRLVSRMLRGHDAMWTDKLGPSETGLAANKIWENPLIPSGYTYLLQLIAHDVVASTASHSLNRDTPASIDNARSRALCLDTIYGGGPLATPHPYEFSVDNRDSRGLIPRTRFRLSEPKPRSGVATSACPFHDVGRAMATDALDSGRDRENRREWLTEALVADPRNDSHALISQLTALFHIFHNCVVDDLRKRPIAQKDWKDPELHHRRFLAARAAVTIIYRAIIVHDLLPRILDPGVYRRYMSDPALPVEAEKAIAREFSHGAFRFGHAMVRDDYRVNSDNPRDTIRALKQSTQRSPGFVPVTAEWMVDWARFFEVDAGPAGPRPNASRRLGPDYPFVFATQELFPSIAASDGIGLAFRDLMSATFAGLRSVPDLCAKFAPHVPAFDIWKAPLAAWLAEHPATTPGLGEPITAADIAVLASDPPLPFFVLFEAAHTIGADGKPSRVGGGARLGPLGSTIVAETIFGALEAHPIGFEGEADTAAAAPAVDIQLADCAEAVLHDRAAFASLGAIRDMPALLRFMQAAGAFNRSTQV